MATVVLTDAYVTLAGTNVSAQLKKVEFPIEVEALDDTAMGATARSRAAGLEDASLSMELKNSYGAGSIEELLWNNKGTAVAVVIRPTSAAVGVGNPQYDGTVLVTQTQPVSGGVGEIAMQSVSLPATAAFSRSTS